MSRWHVWQNWHLNTLTWKQFLAVYLQGLLPFLSQKTFFSVLFRCGIVPEGDFELRESEKSEGEGISEHLGIEEQPNHDTQLAEELSSCRQ